MNLRAATAADFRAVLLLNQEYEAVLEHALNAGVPQVACEYDVVPPNPASARFHDRFGFVEVGRQSVAGGRKQVSLQVAPACAKIPDG